MNDKQDAKEESSASNPKPYNPSPPQQYTTSWKLLSQGAEARVWIVPSYTSLVPSIPTSNLIPSQTSDDDDSHIHSHDNHQCICKERFSKSYRIPQLDRVITKSRIKSEIKCLAKCRTVGVRTPHLLGVDMESGSIYMERVVGGDGSDDIIPALTVRAYFESVRLGYIQKLKLDELNDCPKTATLDGNGEHENSDKCNDDDCASTVDYGTNSLLIARTMGEMIAQMHNSAGVIHGDLTTSNIMLSNPPSITSTSTPTPTSCTQNTDTDQPTVAANATATHTNTTDWKPILTLIDFGLSTLIDVNKKGRYEEKAVDLYVMERAFASTHPGSRALVTAAEDAYRRSCELHDAKQLQLQQQETPQPPQPQQTHPAAGTEEEIRQKSARKLKSESKKRRKMDLNRKSSADMVFNRLEEVRRRGRKRECFG
eukprot:CAMPEP_0194360816 /NCGR_PEP_ID=MMETSP0174-20130528/8250_1 /TAXON_ID=216777 /ORGANISM="Proboscia alata, Strain PI-D3" /LENGTH=425 /DNA_ID=CAMNT_0039132565 /DNA_START=147 /DNA_END=1424 /DNA_ORIENTATION=-